MSTPVSRTAMLWPTPLKPVACIAVAPTRGVLWSSASFIGVSGMTSATSGDVASWASASGGASTATTGNA